jgi:hypothetical protein
MQALMFVTLRRKYIEAISINLLAILSPVKINTTFQTQKINLLSLSNILNPNIFYFEIEKYVRR